MTLNPSARVILTILAVTVATVAAAGLPGFPEWVEIVLAGLAAGFAAVGIIPPGATRKTVTTRSWGDRSTGPGAGP